MPLPRERSSQPLSHVNVSISITYTIHMSIYASKYGALLLMHVVTERRIQALECNV